MSDTRAYQALTQEAAVADLSDRTRIEITGADRATLLHNLCTNEVNQRSPGDGFEAFFCDARGKILGFATLFVLPTSIVIESSPGQAETLMAHLDRYVIREDAQLRDLTGEWAELLVAGPQATRVLEQASGGSVLLPPHGNVSLSIGGNTLLLADTGYTGPDSFLLFLPAAEVAVVRAALEAAGATPCDAAAVETARVEAGTPIYGRDILRDNLPQEVARNARAISFTKGCYLGQETVARIDALGHVNRLLVGCRFAGDVAPRAGVELRSGDKLVGHVTSGVLSPALAAPLAMAYVRREFHSPGTRLVSELGSVEVVEFPRRR